MIFKIYLKNIDFMIKQTNVRVNNVK